MIEAGSSFIPVYKSEVKKNSLNPTWKPIKMNLQHLCNGDMVLVMFIFWRLWVGFIKQANVLCLCQDCPLKIECLNFNGSGRHDLIGYCWIKPLLKMMLLRRDACVSHNIYVFISAFQTSVNQLQNMVINQAETINLERLSSGYQQSSKVCMITYAKLNTSRSCWLSILIILVHFSRIDDQIPNVYNLFFMYACVQYCIFVSHFLLLDLFCG